MNGLILQMARERAGISRDQCAAWLQVDAADLAAWEAGERDIPLACFELLIARLGLTIGEFSEGALAPRDALLAERVGRRLRAAREAEGLPAAELAAAIGLTEADWAAVEAGSQPIGIAALGTVARRLSRTLEDLLAPGGDAKPSAQLSHLTPELADWVADPANIATLAAARQLAAFPREELLALSRLFEGVARQEGS